MNERGHNSLSGKESRLLEIRDLETYFETDYGLVRAVDGVNFSIKKGEVLGVVGESGCGKSVTALSIMRLIPTPPGRIAHGEIIFEGENLLAKSERDMRSFRGNKCSMIFQEPMTSLNPMLTIGRQITEVIKLHQNVKMKAGREQAIEMLTKVGIPSPEKRIDEYPHQMSGGMRQRVMIAIALSCRPKLLLADEPTTALDVTIQAQILDLMKGLQDELRMAIIFITHDMGIVAETTDKVVIMYSGKIVESAPTETIFEDPLHPYTTGLLSSLPRIDENREILPVIEGNVPSPFDMPKGCRFHPRCSFVKDICNREEPPLSIVGLGHEVRCWQYVEYA